MAIRMVISLLACLTLLFGLRQPVLVNYGSMLEDPKNVLVACDKYGDSYGAPSIGLELEYVSSF